MQHHAQRKRCVDWARRYTSKRKRKNDAFCVCFLSKIFHDFFLGNPQIQEGGQNKYDRHDHNHFFYVIEAVLDRGNPPVLVNNKQYNVSCRDEQDKQVFFCFSQNLHTITPITSAIIIANRKLGWVRTAVNFSPNSRFSS